MSTPQIAALPATPSRNMTPDAFIAAADAFIAALPAFVSQCNILAAFCVNTDLASVLSAAAYSASAQTSNSQSQAAANTALIQASEAAASAALAAAIVGIPPAFTALITQPNKITVDMTIPDGHNAVIVGDFEVGPNVTVTGLGNSSFVGLG